MTIKRLPLATPFMKGPVWVYDNWAAYTDGYYAPDDDTRLTETLALRQLREVVRLKHHGVRFDGYMMNAFWFEPGGAYRKWRLPDWPEGPDRWLEACRASDLVPGLWFGTNGLWKIDVASQWRDSLSPPPQSSAERAPFPAVCMYAGGFLTDFLEVLQHWYESGVRMFEFDAANMDARAPGDLDTPIAEVRERNAAALRAALQGFRARNPDVLLFAFNNFGGDIFSTVGPFPFRNPVDLRWLEVFDTLYTGDTRVSDVPLLNFWRSVDLFNDHMVRRYEQSGVPLERCDPFFTLSTTHFGYKRGKTAWKSMLLLSAARGSWKKTIYGDLSLLDDQDAHWFSKVQQLYDPLLGFGRARTFGCIPGETEPYGFGSADPAGALYTVVNPTQAVCTMELPRLSREQSPLQGGRILFRDAGFVSQSNSSQLTLGPEQMALVGFGRYADAQHDLGVEQDVIIPGKIERVPARFHVKGGNVVEATVTVPLTANLRIVVQQRAADGSAPRSPRMKIEAVQNGHVLPLDQSDQARAITTGISWAAGEVRHQDLTPGESLTLRCISSEKASVTLEVSVYAVEYHSETASGTALPRA